MKMVVISEKEAENTKFLISENEKRMQKLRNEIAALEEENIELLWELKVIEEELSKTS